MAIRALSYFTKERFSLYNTVFTLVLVEEAWLYPEEAKHL
jgi:hypothetical protein